MEEQKLLKIIGISVIVVLGGFTLILICIGGIRCLFKYFRKRKYEEDASEEGNILAVGGGNSSEDVLTTKNEVEDNRAAKKRKRFEIIIQFISNI